MSIFDKSALPAGTVIEVAADAALPAGWQMLDAFGPGAYKQGYSLADGMLPQQTPDLPLAGTDADPHADAWAAFPLAGNGYATRVRTAGVVTNVYVFDPASGVDAWFDITGALGTHSSQFAEIVGAHAIGVDGQTGLHRVLLVGKTAVVGQEHKFATVVLDFDQNMGTFSVVASSETAGSFTDDGVPRQRCALAWALDGATQKLVYPLYAPGGYLAIDPDTGALEQIAQGSYLNALITRFIASERTSGKTLIGYFSDNVVRARKLYIDRTGAATLRTVYFGNLVPVPGAVSPFGVRAVSNGFGAFTVLSAQATYEVALGDAGVTSVAQTMAAHPLLAAFSSPTVLTATDHGAGLLRLLCAVKTSTAPGTTTWVGRELVLNYPQAKALFVRLAKKVA